MAGTVYYNANIITMDPELPRARVMLVVEDRIAQIGQDVESIERAASGPGGVPDAERVDLRGRTVVPGFNDNHLHAVILGDHLDVPSLSGLDAPAIVERLKRHYAGVGPDALVFGYEWDFPSCPAPHKSILDAAFPDNPVVLAQYGGHGQWLNSKALARIGVGRDTPDPPHGSILRDESGEATGIVRELSNPLIRRHFSSIFRKKELREPRLKAALERFRRLGITSVQDNTWYVQPVHSLAALQRRGELTARFSCWSDGRAPARIPLMRFARYDDTWVRRGPWKYFLDGSFTTRTAWLREPYEDEPQSTGAGMSADDLEKILDRLAARRIQAAFHAIGDRAIHQFLNVLETVSTRHPAARRLRFRIEHGQLIARDDIARLKELGVLVAAQPSALGTPEKDVALLGSERAARCYPYRSLLDAGVHLSFGSDIPGEFTCDPLLEIDMAVNRTGPERISAEEALRCYTAGSAYAEFQEHQKGMLRPGYLADFTVLSDDITRLGDRELAEGGIRRTRVEMTVVGGRRVYCVEDEAKPGNGAEPPGRTRFAAPAHQAARAASSGDDGQHPAEHGLAGPRAAEQHPAEPRPAFDPQPKALLGDVVSLIPLGDDHAEDLFRAGSDDSIWRYLPQPRPQSVEEMRRLIAEAVRATVEGRELAFAIVERDTGIAIGSTRYCLIERPHRHLEIGWTWIATAYQRTPVNTECKFLLLRHAFEDLGAMRVSLKTDSRNIRSQNAIRRLGAAYEGTLRRHRICWDGHLRDTVYFSIIDDEWPTVREKLAEMLDRRARA